MGPALEVNALCHKSLLWLGGDSLITGLTVAAGAWHCCNYENQPVLSLPFTRKIDFYTRSLGEASRMVWHSVLVPHVFAISGSDFSPSASVVWFQKAFITWAHSIFDDDCHLLLYLLCVFSGVLVNHITVIYLWSSSCLLHWLLHRGSVLSIFYEFLQICPFIIYCSAGVYGFSKGLRK